MAYTPIRYILTILAGAVATGACAGMLIGVALATFVPGYYAQVVPGWDPLTYGIGVGVSQGAAAGFGIGAVAMYVATYRLTPRTSEPGSLPSSVARWLRFAVFGFLMLTVGLLGGGFLGHAIGATVERQSVVRAEGQASADAIDTAGIDIGLTRVHKRGVIIEATVNSEDAAKRLRATIERAVGAAAIERGRVLLEVDVVERRPSD
jgi:hypothetical protein